MKCEIVQIHTFQGYHPSEDDLHPIKIKLIGKKDKCREYLQKNRWIGIDYLGMETATNIN